MKNKKAITPFYDATSMSITFEAVFYQNQKLNKNKNLIASFLKRDSPKTLGACHVWESAFEIKVFKVSLRVIFSKPRSLVFCAILL